MSIERFIAAAAGLIVLAAAGPARAQPGVRADVAGGYSALSASSGSMPVGWFASATYNVNDVIGIASEISGNYGWPRTPIVNLSTSINEYSFLTGPRLVLAAGDKQVGYAHFLIGAAVASATGTGVFGRSVVSNTASATAICYAPGLGWDIEFRDNTSLRVEGNFRLLTADGSVSEFQFYIGVARRFRR
ncbi:MAG TPA: outer membrane beta-barrel protein [Vicinamibacterales bacterium]|nr:outer membrane beta-barrel protein [Vicinamibacterales bacterium]